MYAVSVHWESTLSKSHIFSAIGKGILRGDPWFLSNSVDRSNAVGRALARLARSKLDCDEEDELNVTTFALVSHSIGTHAAHSFLKHAPQVPMFNIMFNPHLYKETLIANRVKFNAPTIIVMNVGDSQLQKSGWFLNKTPLGRIANLIRPFPDEILVDQIMVTKECQVILIREDEARAYGDYAKHFAYLNPSIRDVVYEVLNGYKPSFLVQSRNARFGKVEHCPDTDWYMCTVHFSALTTFERQSLRHFLEASKHRYQHQLNAVPLQSRGEQFSKTDVAVDMDMEQDCYFRAQNMRFHGWSWTDIKKYTDAMALQQGYDDFPEGLVITDANTE